MRSFNCPSCGAQGGFHSPVSVYAVCAYCQSMLMRKDVDVTAFGKMASLPADMSPLQIGTGGMLDGLHFSLLGRVKNAWTDGMWNEWFMLTDAGRKGWLVEAQGLLTCCFELPPAADGQTPLNRNLAKWKPRLGETLGLGDKVYTISDIKSATCLGSEGELPYIANPGRNTTVVDCTGAHHTDYACIELYQDSARCFSGRYVSFDALRFTNLRPLDGWTPR